jgi:L-alanine-DL-glutamate epimerase-like enolase superfamily enzyme
MTRPDRIDSVDLSLAFLPLAVPISDAKVLTGRQKPLTQVAFLFALVRTADGAEGFGFSYSKRAGGPGLYAHAREIAPELIGEDPSDIGRLWEKLAWAGASVGRGGLAVQAIAALDVALMVDANQQWTRTTALRIGRIFEEFDLTWIEEPLDAHDAEGHAALAAALDTPVATGEMLTSVAEHERMIRAGAADFVQPDAPRVGGITPFLKVAALAEQHRLSVAPHFAMELHVHLAAAYPYEVWVEHFDWLEPLFNERLLVADGKMMVPDRPGLGLTLTEQAAAWTVDRTAIGSGA